MARGSLGTLEMIEVSDEVLNSTRAGRGHGEYDRFIAGFVESNQRGVQVGFTGVKAGSVKAGLGSAIERAVEAGLIAEGEVQVRTLNGNVYLLRVEPNGEEA